MLIFPETFEHLVYSIIDSTIKGSGMLIAGKGD